MALFLFTKAILEGQPIKVFNHGKMQRDFTYIDDIVEGVVLDQRILDSRPRAQPRVVRRAARSPFLQGPLPRLQHRQQQGVAGGTEFLMLVANAP
jgi:hypothetical protein